MSEFNQPKGKIRVFACGGAGTNIGYQLEGYRNKEEPGFATVDVTYIDTSRSNLMEKKITENSTYLLDGLDGSGKVRAENYEAIRNNILNILLKFPAADLNIVLSSGGGGSGSVIAPSLAAKLLEDGHPTIIILVGSSNTRKDADNTLKTIKSYDGIRQKQDVPVVVAYEENSRDTPEKTVDKNIFRLIISLAALFSRENKGLDSQDLKNFLNYLKVATFGPQVVGLKMLDINETFEDIGNVITVATLVREDQDHSINTTPDYQCYGYVGSKVEGAIFEGLPIHFALVEGHMNQVAKSLTKKLDDREKIQRARQAQSLGGITSDRDRPDDSGMVL